MYSLNSTTGKLEYKLENINTRDVWSGMREMTSFRRKAGGAAQVNEQLATEFNHFFSRFHFSSPKAPHHARSGHQLSPSPVCIGGTDVDLVKSYKYLGVVLDNKLECSTNYLSNSGVKYSETTDGRF